MICYQMQITLRKGRCIIFLLHKKSLVAWGRSAKRDAVKNKKKNLLPFTSRPPKSTPRRPDESHYKRRVTPVQQHVQRTPTAGAHTHSGISRKAAGPTATCTKPPASTRPHASQDAHAPLPHPEPGEPPQDSAAMQPSPLRPLKPRPGHLCP